MEYQAEIDGENWTINKSKDGFKIDETEHSLTFEKRGNEYLIYNENKIDRIKVLNRKGNLMSLLINGKETEVAIKDHIALMLERLGMDSSFEESLSEIVAPMPGVILDVQIKSGDEVTQGDPLLVLEAMKMENVIKSPINGKINSVEVRQGDSVEKNVLLVTFD